MAAEFAPDLDDGELWLPCAIIPDVADFGFHCRSSPAVGRPELALFEDLAQQLTALGFVDRTCPLPPPKQTNPLPLPLPQPRPDLRLPPPPAAAAASLPVYRQPGRAGTGAYLPEPRRGLQVSYGKALPVHPQPQQTVRARPPPQQRQANLFVPPVRPAGPASGTGVFLPRLAVDVGKKKANKNTEGKKPGEQRRQQKETAVEKKQETAVPVSPTAEMGLPKEWIY